MIARRRLFVFALAACVAAGAFAQDDPADPDMPVEKIPAVKPGLAGPPCHVAVWEVRDLNTVNDLQWLAPLVRQTLVLLGNRVPGLTVSADHVVQVQRMRREFADLGHDHADRVRKVAEALAVDRVAFGLVSAGAERVELTFRIVDGATGVVVHTETVNLDRGKTRQLVEKAVEVIVGGCNRHSAGRGPDAKVEPVALDRRVSFDDAARKRASAIFTDSDEAMMLFAQGMATRDEYLSGNFMKQALEKDASFAAAMVVRAVELARLKDYETSLALFNRAAKTAGDWHRVYDNRGYLLMGGGHPEKALEDFTRGIAKKPEYAPLWNNRGTLHLRQGKLQDALVDFTEAIRLNPRQVMYRSNRGSTFRRLERLEEAVADYGKVIEQKPDFVRAYYNRAITLMEMGREAEALEDVRTLREKGAPVSRAFAEQLNKAKARYEAGKKTGKEAE